MLCITIHVPLAARAALQHKILRRMRSLGMTPVLPAFAGCPRPAMYCLRLKPVLRNCCGCNAHQ